MQKKAFVVGANKNKLKFAVKDANKIAYAFLDEGYIIASKEVTNFIASEFYYAFKEFVDDLKEADQVIFYFVGHSFLGNNNMLYLAIESSDVNDYKTCIGAAEITFIIQQCRAKNKMIIMDSCYSSALVATANFNLRKVNYSIICASEPWKEVPEIDAEGIEGGFLSHLMHLALKGQDLAALNEEKRLTPKSLKKWLYHKNTEYQYLNIPKIKVDNKIDTVFVLTSFDVGSRKKVKGKIQPLKTISQIIESTNKKSSLSHQFKVSLLKMQLESLADEQQILMRHFKALSMDKQLELDRMRKDHYQQRIEAKLEEISLVISKVQKIEKELKQIN